MAMENNLHFAPHQLYWLNKLKGSSIFNRALLNFFVEINLCVLELGSLLISHGVKENRRVYEETGPLLLTRVRLSFNVAFLLSCPSSIPEPGLLRVTLHVAMAVLPSRLWTSPLFVAKFP